MPTEPIQRFTIRDEERNRVEHPTGEYVRFADVQPVQPHLSDEDRKELERIAGYIGKGAVNHPQIADAAFLRKLASQQPVLGQGVEGLRKALLSYEACRAGAAAISIGEPSDGDVVEVRHEIEAALEVAALSQQGEEEACQQQHGEVEEDAALVEVLQSSRALLDCYAEELENSGDGSGVRLLIGRIDKQLAQHHVPTKGQEGR